MFNSDMLEVAIGLVFVYLLFSFVATALREGFEAWAKQRGILLERGVLGLLTDPSATAPDADADARQKAIDEAERLLAQFYTSPPIFGLFRGGYVAPSQRAQPGQNMARNLPSYIPSRNFAAGLLCVVERYAGAGAGGAPGSLDRIRLALEGVPNAQVRDVVRTGIRLSGGDPDKVRQHLEDWFNGAMDRVAGQYRRATQGLVFVGSLLVAVGLNINTIVIVQALTQNSAMRTAIANNAGLVAATPIANANQKLDAQIGAIRKTGLPIGWDTDVRARLSEMSMEGPDIGAKTASHRSETVLPLGWILVLLGWVMTALAISLGAPFWFDVLNKFMVVRATVKPQEKSAQEESKDPTAAAQAPAPAAVFPAANAATGAVQAQAAPAATSTSISDTDRAEFGALDPTERPREEA